MLRPLWPGQLYLAVVENAADLILAAPEADLADLFRHRQGLTNGIIMSIVQLLALFAGTIVYGDVQPITLERALVTQALLNFAVDFGARFPA